MSLESVRRHFEELALDLTIIETSEETSTVESAARVLGVGAARIAKTLAFRLVEPMVILLVTRGDARIDNVKFKQHFGKAKMLAPEDVELLTGHPVGGVCPFGLRTPLPVYADVSMRAFDRVYPAAGSRNSAFCIAPSALAQLTHATWVDVCRIPG